MPDSRLLLLHRAWCVSRCPADEAAYLRERVRVGELTQERLRLAASCDHAGARLAVGDTGVQESDLGRWVYTLRSWGRRGEWPPGSRVVYRLAAVGAAEVAVGAWRGAGGGSPAPGQVLSRLEAWSLEDREVEPDPIHDSYLQLAHAAAEAADLTLAKDRIHAAQAIEVLRVALCAFSYPAPPNASAASAARCAAKLGAAEQVRAAISGRVLAWALAA